MQATKENDQSISQLARSIMAPELHKAGATYPDGEYGAIQVRSEQISYLFNVPHATNFYQYLFLMPRYSSTCMAAGLRVYARKSAGALWTFQESRIFDATAADNFARMQFIAGAFDVDSTTISTTTTNLEGTAASAVLGHLPKLEDLSTSNLDDYAIRGHSTSQIPLREGVRAAALPITAAKYRAPYRVSLPEVKTTENSDYVTVTAWYRNGVAPMAPNAGSWTAAPGANGPYITFNAGFPNELPANLCGRVRVSVAFNAVQGASVQSANLNINVTVVKPTSATDPTALAETTTIPVTATAGTVTSVHTITGEVMLDTGGHFIQTITIANDNNAASLTNIADCSASVKIECLDMVCETMDAIPVALITLPGDRQINVNAAIQYAAVPTAETQRLLQLDVPRMGFTRDYSDIIHSYVSSNPDIYRAAVSKPENQIQLSRMNSMADHSLISRRTGFFDKLWQSVSQAAQFLYDNRHQGADVLAMLPDPRAQMVSQFLRNTSSAPGPVKLNRRTTGLGEDSRSVALDRNTTKLSNNRIKVKFSGNCTHCCESSGEDSDADPVLLLDAAAKLLAVSRSQGVSSLDFCQALNELALVVDGDGAAQTELEPTLEMEMVSEPNSPTFSGEQPKLSRSTSGVMEQFDDMLQEMDSLSLLDGALDLDKDAESLGLPATEMYFGETGTAIVVNLGHIGKPSGWNSVIGSKLLQGDTVEEAWPSAQAQLTNRSPESDEQGYNTLKGTGYNSAGDLEDDQVMSSGIANGMKSLGPGLGPAGDTLGRHQIQVTEIKPHAINAFPSMLAEDRQTVALGVYLMEL